MFPAARIGDLITHDLAAPCGSTLHSPYLPCPKCTGAAPVFIEGLPAAHVGCVCACSAVTLAGGLAHPPLPPTPLLPIATGSSTVEIHGLPAVRWTPGPDLASCGALLGDPKQLPKRTVFLGAGIKTFDNLAKLNATTVCLITKMLDPTADTDFMTNNGADEVLNAASGTKDWIDAEVDLHEYKAIWGKSFDDIYKPGDKTIPYDELSEWAAAVIKENDDVMLVLQRADPDSQITRDLRRRVHHQSMRSRSVGSCPGFKQSLKVRLMTSTPLADAPIYWSRLKRSWQYSGGKS